MKPYYEDDAVTLYHGDCQEILPTLPEADLLLTDPPYGVRYASGMVGPYRGSEIVGDGDTAARDWVLAWWGAERPAYVFGSWKVARPSGTRVLLTWDKGDAAGMGDLSLPWKPNTEEVYVLGSGFAGHRGSSVLRGNVVTWASKGREHPNQKPIDLLRGLILKAPDARVVLDPFTGSGTTLRAAKDLGRRAIGVEIEERWCEAAARRLAQEVLDLAA